MGGSTFVKNCFQLKSKYIFKQNDIGSKHLVQGDFYGRRPRIQLKQFVRFQSTGEMEIEQTVKLAF